MQQFVGSLSVLIICYHENRFYHFQPHDSTRFFGIYDPLSRLKSMNFMPSFIWDICSFIASVQDNNGLKFTPNSV